MRKSHKTMFWVTVLISAAFFLFGTIKSVQTGFYKWNAAALAIGVLLLVLAYVIHRDESSVRGGAGGAASSPGERSSAEGGAGGRGIEGIGGPGGAAESSGKESIAKGGRGGGA